MQRRRLILHRLACISIAWLATLATLTWAGTYTPTVVYDMAYATQTEKALFIHGGSAQLNPQATNNQLFALDLTISPWESSNPPWNYLTAPSSGLTARFQGVNTMVMSRDQSRALLFDTTNLDLYPYNISTDTWFDRKKLPLTMTPLDFLAAADPGSDLVYFARGGANNTMFLLNITNGDSWTQPMPPYALLPPYINGYTFVYCAFRKSFLLFGGKDYRPSGNAFNADIFEFPLAAYSWVRLVSAYSSICIFLIARER